MGETGISGQGLGLALREAMGAQRDSQSGEDTRRIGSQDPKTSLPPKWWRQLPCHMVPELSLGQMGARWK